MNLAELQPLVLAIDDVHWADFPSLRFVAHLLPRIAGLPILLVLATRPQSPEPGSDAELLARVASEPALTALRPAGLTQAGSVALVRAQLSSDASDEVCVACHELSGGNPFLLRALMVELADEEGGLDRATADHVRRMTPASVSRASCCDSPSCRRVRSPSPEPPRFSVRARSFAPPACSPDSAPMRVRSTPGA